MSYGCPGIQKDRQCLSSVSIARLCRILVVVWVLSVCKSIRADDGQHGRPADESVPLFSYELMLAEGDEVAHRAGVAFAGLSYDNVSEEVELLACIGDPDFMEDISACEKNEYDKCKSSADAPWYVENGKCIRKYCDAAVVCVR